MTKTSSHTFVRSSKRLNKRNVRPVTRLIDEQSSAVVQARKENVEKKEKEAARAKKIKLTRKVLEARKKDVEEKELKKAQARLQNRKVFVISGATGYGASANGTYRLKKGAVGMGGRPIFNKIEDPNWWVEYAPSCTKANYDGDEDLQRFCEYSGWVVKWEDVKYVRCGYLRSEASASMSATFPWEIQDWEELNPSYGENPTSNSCDWVNTRSWACEQPPDFSVNGSIVVRLASDEDIHAAELEASRRKRLVKAITGGKFKAPALLVSDPGDTYGTFVAIPGCYQNQRPVYAGISSQGSYMELKHTKSGRDGWKWCCDVGDAFINSTCGCSDILPQDVKNWEYDDGHYARWAIGTATVELQENKKEVDRTLVKLEKRKEYRNRVDHKV
jgi:hypothetical protein